MHPWRSAMTDSWSRFCHSLGTLPSPSHWEPLLRESQNLCYHICILKIIFSTSSGFKYLHNTGFSWFY